MDLTKGNIPKVLLRFTLPVLLMNIMNQAYNIADGVITAQFINERALSVISASLAVLLVGYGLLNGAANACPVLIARIFGSGDMAKLRGAVYAAAGASLLISALICAVYVIFAGQIVSASQVPEEIAEDCVKLVIIYAIGFIPNLFLQTGTAILSGMGDSARPMKIEILTQVMNIVLNLLCVLVFGLGLWGVAWASVFSSAVGAVLLWRRVLRSIRAERAVKDLSGSLKLYTSLALPSMLQQSVVTFGNLFLQVLINRQGTAYINGYNVGMNLHTLMIVVIISCCVAFETFAAQNLGAEQPERVRKGFKMLLGIGLGICFMLALLTVFASDALISLYLSDKGGTAFAFARQFLFLMIPAFPLMLFKSSLEAVFKSNLKIYLFTISSLISLAARVAFSYLAFGSLGASALAWGTVFGHGTALVFCLAVFLPNRRKMGFARREVREILNNS